MMRISLKNILYFFLLCSVSVQAQRVELDSVFLSRLPILFPQIKAVNLRSPALKPNLDMVLTKKEMPAKLIPKTNGVNFWTNQNNLVLQINEATFSNWNAGGNNSVSALAVLGFVRKYKFRYLQWDNQLTLRYGINAQEQQKFRKTDDEIRFVSTFGFRKNETSHWFYSIKANFRTQFTHGYKYPNTDKIISSFMAPGYLFLGAGGDYSLDKKRFNFYVSPVTLKATFVLRQELANTGAFGVKKAVYDAQGNLLKEGKQVEQEFGILLTNTWSKELLKNISLKHRINLYTDYLESFGNIDIDWELQLQFLINKYFKANLGGHLIYDDDVRFDVVKNNLGQIVDSGHALTQFKQTLGIGISYDF